MSERKKNPNMQYRLTLLKVSKSIPSSTYEDLKCLFEKNVNIDGSESGLIPLHELENCTCFQFLMKLDERGVIQPGNTGNLQECLRESGNQLLADGLRKMDDDYATLESVHVAQNETITTWFQQWWDNFVDRPMSRQVILSMATRNLVSCILTGQYQKLFKSLANSFLCEQVRGVIVLDLGSGQSQQLPVVNVQQMLDGESLMQLVLEGIMMAGNASENLELLREKMPGLPYPLYLLYKAKMASTSGNQEECKWVYQESKALLDRGIYASKKYHAWLKEALGQTTRHVNAFVEGWTSKAHYHDDAYRIRKDCEPEDEIERALQLVDLTRAKQSQGFAYAYMGTNGDFHVDKKMEYNSSAKEKHGEAIQDGLELLTALGMKRNLANPSNLMTGMRFDGMLRNLRIKQTEMIISKGKQGEADCKEMIHQQLLLVRGEQSRITTILESYHSDLDTDLLQKMSDQFCDLLVNVERGHMKGFTLDNANVSE